MSETSREIFVIGDSHIGLSDGSDKDVVSWIDRLAVRRPHALYLNGDLFHYLIAHRKFLTDSVEKVMARFKALREDGTSIHYVEGNRDFFLKGSFVEDSMTDVGLEYAVPAGHRKYLIVHGDLINDRDWPYRFWRTASKSPVSRLGLELIPRSLAKRFVDSVEQRLARSNFKHKSRIPVELMEDYARRRRQDGFTDVVFGHFHQKLQINADARVTVLPPWYEQHEAMVIDRDTGDVRWEIV